MCVTEVGEFTLEQEAFMFRFEFPQFSIHAVSADKFGHAHFGNPRERRNMALFIKLYRLWREVADIVGRDSSYSAFLAYCREGMEAGRVKYGVQWPEKDCIAEILPELRDAANYAFYDHMKDQLESGRLEPYRRIG